MAEFHFDSARPSGQSDGPWYREMTRYHWFVLFVAALGWLFDCLDQQLFTLARAPAMRDLLGEGSTEAAQKSAGGTVTAIFLLGWATGGLIFGVIGDRIGRAKTMMVTILLYSLCTGLSAFSVGFWDFAFYRFITGLGVGGEFAVGVALVAESMPENARARALSLLQALSAIGNISAALISISLGHLEQSGVAPWRIMFVIGAFPALLAVVIRRRLKEPAGWDALRRERAVAGQLGSYRALFTHPTWRRHAILGVLLASAGVIGLWGIGFFSADLTRIVFRRAFIEQAAAEELQNAPVEDRPAIVADLEFLRRRESLPPAEGNSITLTQQQQELQKKIDGRVGPQLTTYAALALLMLNLGAFPGMYAFGWLAQIIGRRPTFAIAFVLAMLSTAFVFWYLDEPSDIFWMMPVMGFFQLSVFAGYAIYFPELFPTHLRSTGTSFCYNVGRFVAAIGPYTFGLLSSQVFVGLEKEPMRYAGVSMCAIFLLGLAVLPFVPETKGRPLPE